MCNVEPFLASMPIPLSCNWPTAILLFSKLTDFNFPGNSGMARVMCVALQATGPRRNDGQDARDHFVKPPGQRLPTLELPLPRALPDMQVTCDEKMVFCPKAT